MTGRRRIQAVDYHWLRPQLALNALHVSSRTALTAFATRALVAAGVCMAIAGCANPPAVADIGSRLRMISAEQAGKCKFLRSVQYDDRIYTLGKTPGVMKSIGESGLRNEVAARAPEANAIVLTRDESSWFVGSISYQAEAYACAPERI